MGVAESATQGTVGSEELADRPLLRTGEILETVPGVIITQHAGGGKANQYFTRGFNLDHGTDFSIDLDGMPLNLATHAHGQGYADMNIVIPELIDRIDFEKGPYYAANGDFSTVGAAHLVFADMLPADIFKIEGGTDGYMRALLAESVAVASGNLVAGLEVYHENGPWVVPDDYTRYNGMLKYSHGNASLGFSVTAMAYHGSWNSTDQVAESAVASDMISFYGSQSPTDGGYSQRYSLQGEWHSQGPDSASQIMAYAFHYDLNLFSNFTYFLTSPEGDQFEQQDNRNVAGVKASHTFIGEFLGHRMENTIGTEVQASWIDVGLYQTVDRVRTEKVDYAGSIIPATTKTDTVSEISAGLYFDDRIWWAPKFRSDLGLRGDFYDVDVRDLEAANSGDRAAALASPKLSLVLGPWDGTEFYVQGGYGFHSNDARTDTATVNPGQLACRHPPARTCAVARGGGRRAHERRLQAAEHAFHLVPPRRLGTLLQRHRRRQRRDGPLAAGHPALRRRIRQLLRAGVLAHPRPGLRRFVGLLPLADNGRGGCHAGRFARR